MDNLENSFDQFIKESLRDVEVPYDASTWVAMKEKLHTAEVSEVVEVDAAAKGALQNLRVPYERGTWTILSDRLDQIDYNRKLIGLKVIEAAVFILAVMTLVRFLGQLPETHIEHPAPAMAIDQLKQTDAGERTVTLDKVQSSSESSTDFASSETNTRAELSPARIPSASEINGSGTDPVNYIALVSSVSKSVAVIDVWEAGILEQDFRPVRNYLHAPLDALKAQSMLDIPKDAEGLETAGMVALYSMNRKRVETKIGVFTEMNMHDIQAGTPLANFGSIHSQSIVNPAVGIMTNVQFGRFGFDFGLGYEEVRYHSILDFNKVHKVHMPFHLRFTPVDTRLFNLYAKAGVAVHGAMYAKYQEPPLSAAPGFSSANRQEFNDGLLKGGTVESNVYTTRSVGIGIESPVSRAFSIFGEGLHQSHLSGALSSTTTDKFETISVRFGLNYTFK